jgi:transposase
MKFLGKLPGRIPTGRIMQGVAISQQADGWYAAIKQVVPIRALPEAIPGSVIGVSMGLDVIAATSDGEHDRIIENPRNHDLSRKIAQMQSLESIQRPSADRTTVSRLHQKMKRRVMHQLYNELVKPLAAVEMIKVEHESSDVGHLPHEWDGKASNQISVMRLGPALLKQRFGSRVREVECYGNSVTCSRCGEKSDESFGYREDPICKCGSCGAVIHRRINAARNVASKDTIPLEIRET